MKKNLISAMVVGAVLVLGGAALAADSNTLTVSASVTGTCKFASPTSALDFGALDPSVGGDVNKSSTTQFWCTKGVTTDTILAGNGQNWDGAKRRMKDPASGDLIAYTLSLTKDANANAGPGALRTLTISGGILGTDYTGKTAGTGYTDTVTLTITP
jgi:spore coat protein U-like protein